MKNLGHKRPARSLRPQEILVAIYEALEPLVSDVATDPRKLKPGELCRLLNSTPLGDVLSDRRLREHRTRAGNRVGDGKTIDLVRYAAWLAGERLKQAARPTVSTETPAAGDAAYDRKKERERSRNAENSRTGRDIGELPAVEDPQRRVKAWNSFRFFLESYFPHRFPLAWSDDHIELIDEMEQTVIHGGLQAFAMPRGSGKTTISECAVIWAVVTGRRKFVALIGASKAHADEMLESIKAELETNEVLAADFPEVCFPIAALEGINNRCKGQLHCGERTFIRWAGPTIVLPSIAGSSASAAIICVRGITGRVRGMKFTRPDGENARPDLAIVDDPQTDQSARSPNQCTKRLRIITGAILGLAGPGKKIACFIPCTIIERCDLADQVLDRELHPEWNGRKAKLVYEWPTNIEWWEDYAERRRAEVRAGGDGSQSTAHYKKHRKIADAGSRVGWAARFNPDELSALQHAMNKRIDNPETFDAEFQNEPKTAEGDDEAILKATEIAVLINNVPRGTVPLGYSRLSGFIDVQHSLLYWGVCAWSDDFSGALVDYGTWPDQGRSYFSLRDARKKLQPATGTNSVQAAVLAGLSRLIAELMGREWKAEDGQVLRLDQLFCDFKDGNVRKQIAQACRHSGSAAVMPSEGRGLGPADIPMDQFKRREGELLGDHFLIQPNRTYAVRQVTIDTNFWKSFVHARLKTPIGSRGSFTLYGRKGTDHRMLSEHLTAESRKRLKHEKSQREVDVWKLNPNRSDNHWFDVIVGCAVGAAKLGCKLEGSVFKKSAAKKPGRKRNRVSSLAV